MSREHQQDHAPAADHFKGSRIDAPIVESEQAAEAVKAFAGSGKGSAKDMPRLLKLISTRDRDAIGDLMPKLAVRMDGALFLECAQAYGYVVYWTVENALEHSKPPASDAAVRSYLRSQSESDIVALEDHHPVLARVRKLLPGPLGIELPVLAHVPDEMHDKPYLVRWFIESTLPSVAALVLAAAGSAKLAATLDQIDRWSWLDRLHVGGGARYAASLGRLAKGTGNEAVRAQINKMLEKLPTDYEDDPTQVQATARKELEVIDSSTPATDFLDMTARAGHVGSRTDKKSIAYMKGKPAAQILEFALASSLAIEEAMTLLLDADDVMDEHVIALFRGTAYVTERIKALRNDRLRKRIRNVIGRAVPLLDLFSEQAYAEVAHVDVIADEALRQWCYESKDPRTLLWLAAGSAAGMKKGIGHVQREQGFKWAYSLPVDADNTQVRRLALNCNDAKLEQHLHANVLADKQFVFEANEWKAEAIDPDIHGKGDRAKFDVAIRTSGHDEGEIVGRIADLESDERAGVVKDPATLATTLKQLTGDQLVRAVFALSPTISQLLAAQLSFEPNLLSYIRTRPVAEEQAAVKSPAATSAAAALLSASPFVVFPSLLDPNQLARAIAANGKLLEWIFEAAEPNQALALLGKEPVREYAAGALENDPALYKRFPKYKLLMPDAKAGIDAIGANVEGDDERKQHGRYEQGKVKPEGPLVETGEKLHDAAGGARLWDAIDKLGGKVNQTVALSLVRTYPGDQVELLSGRHTAQVDLLRESIYLPPQHVFPQLSFAQLLSCPDAARWLFASEVSFVILILAGQSQVALKQLGRMIDSGAETVTMWLGSLTKGALLEVSERAAIDGLFPHVKTDDARRKLFAIRFGIQLTDKFSADMTTQLWDIMRRLPPAQVNQQTIDTFQREKSPNAAGFWRDGAESKDLVLSDDDKQLEGTDTTYDKAPLLTADQIKKYYGLDDAAFTKAIDPKHGWIIAVGNQYKVKPIEVGQLKATVLHEIGHSIDTLLGERTELVFGLAGWKNYGIDQVEAWANDMGALDGVRGKDREQIVEAWQQSLHSGSNVKDLVNTDHPALDSKYKDVPLVAAARAGSKFEHAERRHVRGRVGLTGNNQGTIASVPKATADVAPSAYSLSAPGEFFAECYAEYYREFDGTNPEGKGGKLAPWIRNWFTANVDKIELNPQRYAKKP